MLNNFHAISAHTHSINPNRPSCVCLAYPYGNCIAHFLLTWKSTLWAGCQSCGSDSTYKSNIFIVLELHKHLFRKRAFSRYDYVAAFAATKVNTVINDIVANSRIQHDATTARRQLLLCWYCHFLVVMQAVKKQMSDSLWHDEGNQSRYWSN